MRGSWRVAWAVLLIGAGCAGAPGPEPPTNRSGVLPPAAVGAAPASTGRASAAPAPVPRIARACDLPASGARPQLGDGEGGGCPSSSCGSNSPVLNVFPYNGLHPDGCVNQDGAALEKFSLQRDLSPCDHGGKARLYLDVAATPHGFELVGKDDHDAVVCSGTALVGATFQVTGQVTGRVTGQVTGQVTGRVTGVPSAKLRISQIGAIEAARPGSGKPVTRTGYLITPFDQPANSLCAARPPGEAEKPAPILNSRSSKDGKLTTITEDMQSLYAIVIPGAVYSYRSQLIPESVAADPARAGAGHRWFNLACAGDALAHTELSGMITQPIVDRASAEARLPGLHMYTAQYCDGVSATSRGTPIAWSAKGIAMVQPRPETGVGPIEARWNKDGATCLSHSRLWVSNKTISLPAQLVAMPVFSDLAPPWDGTLSEHDFLTRLCGKRLEPCAGPAQPDTLTSYTVNHEK